jgi:hypothetical protein
MDGGQDRETSKSGFSVKDQTRQSVLAGLKDMVRGRALAVLDIVS